MKLDPRIIEGKRPLFCIDTDETKQFIGKEGYFAEEVSMYQNLDYFTGSLSVLKHTDCFKKWKLQEIKDNATCCFKDNILSKWWNYFLPEEWVQKEKPEPKYRPYKNYDEFYRDFTVGQLITYRDKGCNCIHHAEIIEAFAHTDGDVFVGIGNAVKALSGWFQTIEVKDPETGAWVPFGVEE